MYGMYDLTLTKNWIFEFECVLSLQRTSLNKIKKTILSPGTYCTHNHDSLVEILGPLSD